MLGTSEILFLRIGNECKQVAVSASSTEVGPEGGHPTRFGTESRFMWNVLACLSPCPVEIPVCVFHLH